MSTIRKSRMSFISDGAQTAFPFGWDYIAKSYMKVSVNAVDLRYTTDYYVSGQTLYMVQPIAAGSKVIIYRETPSNRLVSWSDGSILKAADFTLFEIQLLHLMEETEDKLAEMAFSIDPADDAWDAKGFKIKNAGVATDLDDVVTIRYMNSVHITYVTAVEELLRQVVAARNATLGFKGEAETARDQSLNYKDAAETARDRAIAAQEATQLLVNDVTNAYDPLAARVTTAEGDIGLLNSAVNTKMDNDRITVDFDTPVDGEGANGDLWFVAAVPEA